MMNLPREARSRSLLRKPRKVVASSVRVKMANSEVRNLANETANSSGKGIANRHSNNNSSVRWSWNNNWMNRNRHVRAYAKDMMK